MGWNRRYAIVSYLRSSLWTVPLFALAMEQIGVRFLTFIDQSLQWVPALAVTAADSTLRAQIAFGPERTMEQDAMFAFRMIADVAVKALPSTIQPRRFGHSIRSIDFCALSVATTCTMKPCTATSGRSG